MSLLFIILAGLAAVASIVCGIIILIDAFEDELWKGLLCLVFWPYTLYHAIFDFDHEHKWPIVIGALASGGIATGLLSMAGR